MLPMETFQDESEAVKKVWWLRRAEYWIGYIFMFLIFFGGLIALGVPQPVMKNSANPLCEQIFNMTIELENIRSSSSEPEVALQLTIFVQKMKDLTKVDSIYCGETNTKPAEATLWLAIYTLADSFTQYYRVVYSFPSAKSFSMNCAKTVAALSSIIFGFTGFFGICHFILLLPQKLFYLQIDGLLFYSLIIIGGIASADERTRTTIKSNDYNENKFLLAYSTVCQLAVVLYFVAFKYEAFLLYHDHQYLLAIPVAVTLTFLRGFYINRPSAHRRGHGNHHHHQP